VNGMHSELRRVLEHFRPTFPWSFVKYESERWELRQYLKTLLSKDTYYGDPLPHVSAERLWNYAQHSDWLMRFGAKTVLHFSGKQDLSNDPEFSKWLFRYLELKRPKRIPAQTYDVSRGAILRRYPFLATPAKDWLLERLQEARDISKQLGRPVLVFGGVTKGTSMPPGDLDYAVVSREQMRPPESHQAVPVITPESRDAVSLSILFLGNGIFTGNRRLVRDVQRAVVSQITEKEWEAARKNTAKNEAQIHHVISLFGVPPEKAPLVAALRVLDSTPPTLEKARRILRVV
jgi:hypothetical protein